MQRQYCNQWVEKIWPYNWILSLHQQLNFLSFQSLEVFRAFKIEPFTILGWFTLYDRTSSPQVFNLKEIKHHPFRARTLAPQIEYSLGGSWIHPASSGVLVNDQILGCPLCLLILLHNPCNVYFLHLPPCSFWLHFPLWCTKRWTPLTLGYYLYIIRN